MNHIFKIVWSVANNAWVVTSELGKSRSKNSSKIKKTVVASLALALASTGASYANSCVFTGENTIDGATCEQAIVDKTAGGKKFIIKDTTINVSYEDQSARGGGAIGLVSSVQNKGILLEVESINMNNEGSASSGIWVESHGENSDVTINIKGQNNKIKMGGASNTAVLAQGDTASNAIINVDGDLDIFHNTTTFGESDADGLEVRANNREDKNNKSGEINFNGKGNIIVGGGNAVYAVLRSLYSGGAAIVKIKKGDGQEDTINLITNSKKNNHDEANGIKAITEYGKKTQVIIDNDANIYIEGAIGKGIYASLKNSYAEEADGNSISITNSGTIKVGQTKSEVKDGKIETEDLTEFDTEKNKEGHGIFSDIVMYGSTEVVNTGDISVVGKHANAIHVIGNNDTKISNAGKLTSNHYGIYAEDNGESNGKDPNNKAISITNSSIIEGGLAGLYIKRGAATIENTGDISSNNDLAIESTAGNGSSINNSGIITGRILADETMNFVNSGTFNVRHVENGVQRVAVSDFAGGTITNTKTGTIKFGDVPHSSKPETEGSIQWKGDGQQRLPENGLMQGHLDGVKSFFILGF